MTSVKKLTLKTPIKEHWLTLASIGFIITSGVGFLAVSPILLGGMVEQLGFSKQLIGYITAINSLGVAIAALIVSVVIPRFGILNLVRTGLLVLLLSEIGASFSTTPASMLFFRFIAGLSGGLTYASALSALASISQPIRGFSTYTIVFCSLSSLTLFALPFIINQFSLSAGFLLLGSYAAIGLLLSGFLKHFTPKSQGQKIDASVLKQLGRKSIFFTVLAYFALQAGAVTIFAFLERIGNEKGFSPAVIGLSLGLSGLCGIAGGILANTLRKRLGIQQLLWIGFPALGICLLIFYFGINPLSYVLAILIFAIAWTFILPIYQSIQAAYDTEGKIVSIGAFMNMLGQSSGPALASLLLGASPYINVLWISLVMFIISGLSIIPSILGLKSRPA